MTSFNINNNRIATSAAKTRAKRIMPVLGAILLLSACSHPNPLLKNQTPAGLKAHAEYLIKVAKIAGSTVVNPPDFSGNGAALYEDCMDGKYSRHVCQPLYQAMGDYIATTQPSYHIRVADIEDQSMWQKLGKTYEETRFYDSPDLPMEF